MSLEANELEIIIAAQVEDANKKLDEVSQKLESLSKTSSKTTSSMTSSIGELVKKYVSVAAAVKLVTTSITNSMERIEDENLFEVSLGDSADEVRAWSNEIENAVGVSGAWLRKTTGTLTNMTTSMGVSSSEAVEMSKNFSLLAQDMASFYNITADEALSKLQSGLAGQSRPLQELGIMIRDTDLEATALTLGIEKVDGEFTSAQKAILVYNTVLNATKNAQGDLARTINTPANQLRMLKTNIENLSVAFGDLFTPLETQLLPVLNAITIAATKAFNALGAIFGVQMTESDAEDVDSSTSNIASNLDDATDSAKTLKQQLAGFDEMNVLKENDSSSSSSSGSDYSGFSIASYDSGITKVVNNATEMAEKLYKELSEMFDLQKIKKNLTRLWNDIKKGLTTVGKIMSDVWNSYFKPFVNWLTGDFAGGVFNAIGGAIEFLANVIAQTWDAYLKPFIDTFIKPIAEFTGGVIVDVLNWIGDALRVIAENKVAVEIVSAIVAVIGGFVGLTAIINGFTKAWGLLVSAFYTVSGAAEGVFLLLKDGLTSLGTQIASVINGFTGATAGSQLFVSSLAAGIVVVEAVIAVFVAVVTVLEAISLAQSEAELEALNYITTEEHETEVTNWNNDAIQTQVDLKNELAGEQKNLADATISYLNAQDNLNDSQTTAISVAEKYGMTLDEAKEYVANLDVTTGELTTKERELADAVLDLESKEGSLTEQLEKLNDSKQAITQTSEEYGNAVWKEIMTTKEAELEQLAMAGNYDELKQKLVELSEETITYKDINGEMTQFTEEDVENMADFIANHLAQVDDDWGKTWNEMWNSSNCSITNLKNAVENVSSSAYESGKAIPEGVSKGISQNTWTATKSISSFASNLISEFNSRLDIHSPSKVFAESGKWIDAGLAQGITDNADYMQSAISNLAEKSVSALDDYNLTTTVTPTLSNSLLSANLDIDESKTPVHVVVNVGEDTLINKVVDGINNLSGLENRSIISI